MRVGPVSRTDMLPEPVAVGLSVRQPWAELILSGRKTIEVRTWRTRYRGRLWLHAGRRVEREACEVYGFPNRQLAVGSLVGCVDVEDCFGFDEQTWQALSLEHLNLVPFEKRFVGWVLRNPRRIAPIPYRGALGLMKIPLHLVGWNSRV